jgi:hypothetical protein
MKHTNNRPSTESMLSNQIMLCPAFAELFADGSAFAEHFSDAAQFAAQELEEERRYAASRHSIRDDMDRLGITDSDVFDEEDEEEEPAPDQEPRRAF